VPELQQFGVASIFFNFTVERLIEREGIFLYFVMDCLGRLGLLGF
jgi:hypothetical protein